ELDYVQPGHGSEHVHLRLAHLEHAPRDLLLGPGALRAAVRVLRVRPRPELPVLDDVVRKVSQGPGTRARAPAPPTPASPTRARGCPASRARGRRGSSRAPRSRGSSRPSWPAPSRSRLRPRPPKPAS